MKTTATYNHEHENLFDALDVDREKLKYISQAIEKFIEENEKSSKSDIYAKAIQLCDTPEELCLVICKITVERLYYLIGESQEVDGLIHMMELLKMISR